MRDMLKETETAAGTLGLHLQLVEVRSPDEFDLAFSTMIREPASSPTGSGQASPRDNVVFEAGIFGAALGIRRTFILHASASKLPSDLLGLTCVRYGELTTAAAMRVVNKKLRKAIENDGRVARIEGLWWQYSLTERSLREPSAVSLLRISRDRDGALEVGAAHGKRTAASQRDTGAKPRRRGRTLRASTGRESDPGTRTGRSWTARERSGWSPAIARPGTSPHVRTNAWE
jgi:Predicted nucleotide-binding protein containing TIR-like domain